MQVRCGWCGKRSEDKEPLKDTRETTGICDKCAVKALGAIKKRAEREVKK